MSIISPLASFYHVLQTTRISAQAHAGLLHKSEAATRAALIDPILRALGWDTANVQMVEPEKTVNTAWRADYALHDVSGKIDLLLEAKCLGSNLEKFSVVQQLLSYAFGFGVQKVVVTDGISWHFYSEFKPGNSIANSQFNLLQDDPIFCALQLVQWLDAAQSGHGVLPIVPSLPVQIPDTKSAPNRETTPTAQPPKQQQKTESANFTDVSRLHLLSLPPGQKPKQLRLPNGTIKPIVIWKDILLEVCYLVLNTNLHLALPLPDRAGKKRFLFSRTKPETGASTQASYQGKPVFIGTHYSAADCIGNALYAAQQLPPGQKTTSLAVSF